MRIRHPLPTVKDILILLLSDGYQILGHALGNKQDQAVFAAEGEWVTRVDKALRAVFPTAKELGQVLNTPYTGLVYQGMDPVVQDVANRIGHRLSVLEGIISSLADFYDFQPDQKRLYVQSIDSFAKVRDVNHSQVAPYLRDGQVDLSEKQVKEGLIQVIGQSYIPADWAGETEDVCTSRLLLNGERIQASLVLKGPGAVAGKETHTANYGKNGDQLQRMVGVVSRLYIVQSVKPIANDVVTVVDALIDQQRARGNHCYYCIMDGEDTAMVLLAYGLLPAHEKAARPAGVDAAPTPPEAQGG